MKRVGIFALVTAIICLTASCTETTTETAEVSVLSESETQSETLSVIYGEMEGVSIAESVGSVSESIAEGPSVPTGTQVGQRCPEIVLPGLAGQEEFRLSDYAGKLVILNFWAHWCPYCIEEMPAFRQFAEDYAEDTVVVGIHSSEYPNGYLEQMGWTDGKVKYVLDRDCSTMAWIGQANFYPYTVVISPDGTVFQRQPGVMSYVQLVSVHERTIGF